jgi:tRNA A58 N-methylase Trm61
MCTSHDPPALRINGWWWVAAFTRRLTPPVHPTPGTLRVLLKAGLRRGMHVADIGFRVGKVSTLLAELVGAEGSIVGIGARERCEVANSRM